MTTLKERAEVYARATTSGLHVPYFRNAYLAGARDALEMAAQQFPPTAQRFSGYGIRQCLTALLPDDAREPERTP